MLRWLIALLLSVEVIVPASAFAQTAGVTVTVTRDEGDSWIADYRFDHPSRVWFFPRSGVGKDGQPWRIQAWRVETPGVRLRRAGHYDALASSAGPLKRVRIRMTPYARQPSSHYAPVLRFSDGALAFYTDQFTVFPWRSLAGVRALPIDVNGIPVEPAPVTLVLRDPGRRMLLNGKALSGEAVMPLEGAGTFIYTGDAPVLDTPAFAGVIDAGLPMWMTAELRDFTPRLMALYRDRLGPSAIDRPIALIALDQDMSGDPQVSGGVISGMVVMQMRGAPIPVADVAAANLMRAFIGHEAAHFWFGQTFRIEGSGDAWIAEGTADFLAMRAMERLVTGYDPATAIRAAMQECLRLIGPGEALDRAEERGDGRAHYGCGALLMLAAEAATVRHDPGADAFTFIRGLIESNRADGAIDTSDWLARFKLATGDAALTAELRAFITTGVPDPIAFWLRLFAATGVALPKQVRETG